MLEGITWDHPRGIDPLLAMSRELAEATGGAIEVRWEARSLHDFESVSLDELAARYDLLAIDHPFIGRAHTDGALMPLDDLLDAEFLAEVAADSVGPSMDSYRWAGSWWALPMDAAAQVSAYRPNIVAQPPQTWDDVAALSTELPYVMAANPVHLWSSFLSLCHQHAGGAGPVIDYPYQWWDDDGFSADVCMPALQQLVEVVTGADRRSWQLDPIGVLDLMSTGDDLAYCPLVFGYSNYARPGYAPQRIAFANAPSLADGHPGTMLGGVGLAVSSRCSDPDAATLVLRTVLSRTSQRGTYATHGGQPGRRSAWTDPDLNALCPAFFAATLTTLDHALVRPRVTGYPPFQKLAGATLHRGVRAGDDPAAIIDDLSRSWRDAIA